MGFSNLDFFNDEGQLLDPKQYNLGYIIFLVSIF